MFKHLLAQRITRHKEQWYCYLCKSPQSSDKEKAKSHLQEIHLDQISTTKQILQFLEDSNTTNTVCNKLLYNGIVLKNLPHDYFCIICKCPISALTNVHEHIKGINHKNNKATKRENLTTVQQNLNGKQSLVDIENKIKGIKQTLNRPAMMQPNITSQNQLAEPSNTNNDNLIPDCIKSRDRLQDYFCTICKCGIATLRHVHEHVKGIRHTNNIASTKKENVTNAPQNLNRKQNLVDAGNMIKVAEQTLGHPAIMQPTIITQSQLAEPSITNDDNSIPDCIKLKDGLQDYFCTICICGIPTLSHVYEHLKGIRHTNNIANTKKENLTNVQQNLNEKQSLVDVESMGKVAEQTLDHPAIMQPTIITQSQLAEPSITDDVNSISDCIKLKDGLQDYFCTICKCGIPTLSHVHEHVKGIRHTKNRSSTKKENLTNVQQNLNGKQSLVDVENMVKIVKQTLNCHTITEPTITSQNQLAEPSNTNDDNSIPDCIKLKNGLQNYFCTICKYGIPTLSQVHEHLKEEKHQLHKRISTTKGNPRNDPKSSNKNINDMSTLEEISTSRRQAPICIINTLANTSIGMSSKEHPARTWATTWEIPVHKCLHFSMAAADTSRENIILQDKKTPSNLFISDDISTELNSMMKLYLPKAKASGNQIAKNKRKKTASERFNRIYRIEYLLFENIMFSCYEQKLRHIEDNLQFYCLSINERVKCMLCHVSHTSRDAQIWYRHIACDQHKKNQMETPSEMFILLKQMIIKEFENVICYACNEVIDVIDIHINEASHKMNHKRLSTQLKSYYNLLKSTVDLYYTCQYFSCVLCKKRFKAKIEFMDHLFEKHKSIILQQINNKFNFCVTCATFWYEGVSHNYCHCENKIHQHLEKNNDFAVKPLSREVEKLLKCINKNVADLFEQSENISANLDTSQIINDFNQTLESQHLSMVKVCIYGSRCTGLALSNSDIDIYLDFNDECTEAELIKSKGKQIEKCLRADYEVWKITNVLENTRTPIIRCIHLSTGIKCDISYTNGLSLENSKFIRSFNKAYLPGRKLILFLKKWMQLCKLDGSQKITNYALVWLVIFYLQVKHGIPSIASLIKKNKESKIISGWRTISTNWTDGSTSWFDVPKLPMHELLLGFFEYYGIEFEYKYSVICPLLGEKCEKQMFTLDKKSIFPKDMEPYLTHVQGPEPEYFRIDSAMCVQDPFVLSFNITRAVQVLTLRNFKEYCKKSASILTAFHRSTK